MKKWVWILVVLFVAAGEVPSFATVAKAKAYKSAFGLDKAPRCVGCHVPEKPKKEGDHELNEYGKKILALSKDADEETFKKAGPFPEPK